MFNLDILYICIFKLYEYVNVIFNINVRDVFYCYRICNKDLLY